jgi:leucyl-tRNA synthetase
MTKEYDFSSIEEKWQDFWEAQGIFKTEDRSSKPKYYVLDMFPYPSGSGLHVGHVEGYTATDIMARFKKMQGFHVLHPMGWDAFGLPAEQYAIKTGTHPKVTTDTNITYFKKQIRRLGFGIDWSREINTTDPRYYRWSQWIFLQLYKKGLAYESYESVNWCPVLGTVLANEEVIDGKSEVGGHPVIKKPIRQWVLKITAYAERLLADLEDLDWPKSTKEMQKNWIGKSTGAFITFRIKGPGNRSFEVFTTCPHTLFGVTFCVLAPEHPLVSQITTPKQQDEVESYLEETAQKSERDRAALVFEKTGVFTGAFGIHPATGKEIPILVADYVLMGYGTGAVMGVPAHDGRDQEFAEKYDLPIVPVIHGSGVMMGSGPLDGLSSEEAQEKIGLWLEEKSLGRRATTYKLRDWVFSRQRYWGEPFPLLRDEKGQVHPVPEDELPVVLPEVEDYKPSQEESAPLEKAKDWRYVKKDGQIFERETNIMPQWAGSCWYYLRYLDPTNDFQFCAPDKEKFWLPVDLYIGGAEHANLHLLYARFWHKVLYDLGYVSTKEPFQKLVHQGLILGSNGEKMSKSRGNVVNPDDVIREWGADCLRLFEMFMGPLEQAKPWNTNNMTGLERFLKRIWRLVMSEEGALSSFIGESEEPTVTKKFHWTVKKVTEDIEGLRFNTAIAALMELVNTVYKEGTWTRDQAQAFLCLLSPLAPHIAEELWAFLGHTQSICLAQWPSYDPSQIEENQVTLAVMINGKHRGNFEVEKTLGKEEVLALARKLSFVEKHLGNLSPKKEVFVPGKVVNFVI